MLLFNKYESNLIVHGFPSPLQWGGGGGGGRGGTAGDLNMKICQYFVVTKNFLTITLHFHYFSSLETANTQKSKVFLLRVFLGNLILSMHQLLLADILKFYNFSFRKEFLETLCKCIYLGF